MADDDTGYMRFQDFEDGTALNTANGALTQNSRGATGGGAKMVDLEMDDLQMSLDVEEGTMRRKQRNLQDYTVSMHNDPSAERPKTPLERAQHVVLKVVDSMVVRLTSVLFVVIDLVVLIINLSIYGVDRKIDEPVGYLVVSMFFASYFMIELCVRIFARGRAFFRYWYEILDMTIIILSFVMTVIVVSTPHSLSISARIVLAGRLFRVLLLGRIINERYQMSRVSRHVVSQNKRRYMKDGFDLDLTYVTERVIAMGFPSSGKMGLYRNSASEVARFLDTKHRGHYKVYNLCSERGYDHALFHGSVYRMNIDDHNVPLLHDLVEFCEDVHRWMEADPANVIAVHCKGGKGRTGTVICCWLMRTGMYDNAEQCLAYFGERRTDLSKGHRYQGVQTPSQSRFVMYYDDYLHKYDNSLPKSYPYKLTSIRISGINCIGAGDGRDLFLQIIADGSPIADFALYNQTVASKVVADGPKDLLTVDIKESALPVIKGNIKFRFSCSTKLKLKGLYDHSLFFFWVNTGFIQDRRVYLSRDDLDNPHKPKTHSVFRENFSVEVLFEDAE